MKGWLELRTRLPPALDRLAARLPAGARELGVQFFQFGIIGTIGFVWYVGVVYAVAPFVGPYAGGLLGFLVAASSNWLCNRYWTFRDRPRTPLLRQWLAFLAANSAGSVVNLGINFSLLATVPYCRQHLYLPVMIGTLGGVFLNFAASRRLVFK